ncbi:glycosyltransferase [Gordonia sp. DT219]|uniref:glycosyltransferase n=1 Tax=Gordonia sp. DT219 TaxID=3416658 RepID=UPI003CFAFD64
MSAFVRGGHRYLIPTTGDADDPDGRGRAGRDWPAGAIEISPGELRSADLDLVVLQRPEEIELTERWTGRRPGRDLPAVYVEHNTPREHAATSRHPLADQDAIPIVHVTDFNRLMCDCGRARTATIDHGIVDPGYLYTGTVDRAATMINEPDRRWRITGTDLLAPLSRWSGIDVYGIGTTGLESRHPGLGDIRGGGDLDQTQLHAEVAAHRVFVHTARWTSLGLSLIEAMHLGMPVVAVGTTEAPAAVPEGAGVVSNDVDTLGAALAEFVAEPTAARLAGKRAREWALERFGLTRFLERWDQQMYAVCELSSPAPGRKAEVK